MDYFIDIMLILSYIGAISLILVMFLLAQQYEM